MNRETNQTLHRHTHWKQEVEQAGLYLFRYSGVIIGAVLDDFSVRNLRGPFLLQRSRQTHPELTGGQKQSPLQFYLFIYFFKITETSNLCAHLWPHGVGDAT